MAGILDPLYMDRSGLKVSKVLDQLIEQDILPGTHIGSQDFWVGFAELVRELTPVNRALLNRRDQLQAQIDQWHRDRREESKKQNKNQSKNKSHNSAEYKEFLQEIGYLVPEGPDFKIETENVDTEITQQAGPQLVVPINNARFALNAANARWGSLYDALYGTDVIAEKDGAERATTGSYNPVRGARVVKYAKDFLDKVVPLTEGSHHDTNQYAFEAGNLVVTLDTGAKVGLAKPEQALGFNGLQDAPDAILLQQNKLHLEIQFDRVRPVGRDDPAGMNDVLLESALTTIMDCEDSVAAVDAEDKALVYRNWLGLMKGDLEEQIEKNGRIQTRCLNSDRPYQTVTGETFELPGRSLMFVRNVGHLMTNVAILDEDGNELFEGMMDAVITSLIALHDIGRDGCRKNSRTGSVYIVKPKMHGPEEVSFTGELFGRVEQLLGLTENTLKIGIMDEERRTTVNLKECVRAARKRVVFINTGFLDRTGDEIHTSMEAGPFAPKAELKERSWIDAYEDQNVDIGLECGFSGKAQIGKGMWAIPDRMADMMAHKIGHPHAGATTAWVPSPSAAILHAIHYHQINVFDRQKTLSNRKRVSVDRLLDIPLLLEGHQLTPEEIQRELGNNVQGILGYVVRWVEQGIGCSKVPDIRGVGLMEDRATLRISSQHIANWLHHDICSHEQVLNTLKRMAEIVDCQNSGDPNYQNIAPNYGSSAAFKAACHLIFKGMYQPNGYTEPLLHTYRRELKRA